MAAPVPAAVNEAQLERFLRFVQEEGLFSAGGNWGTPVRLRFYLEGLFSGIDLAGKRALDVGAGSGVFSVYLALRGASEVYALEPELAGSQDRMAERFQRMVREVGVTGVQLRRATFEEALPSLTPFDLVLLHNCINHFNEPACAALPGDEAARDFYRRTFGDLGGVTRPGGLLVVADCTRHNFFARLGLRSPLAPTIEWEKHQPPGVWSGLARPAGFRAERVQWTTPGHLGAIGRRFLSNPVAAYFLLGHFALFMRKVTPAS
jgi:SAM-dependent methyltransferase